MPVEGQPVKLPIETERLLLRAYEPADYEGLLATHGDADLVRWIPWGPRPPGEVLEVLERKMGQTMLRDPGGGIALAAVERGSGEFAGDLTLSYNSRVHSLAEIGFMFRTEHQGHGYAVESGHELLRIAFEELGFHRVIGRLERRNPASAKTLERLGMRLEAELLENEWVKGEWQSELAYGILEREWPPG